MPREISTLVISGNSKAKEPGFCRYPNPISPTRQVEKGDKIELGIAPAGRKDQRDVIQRDPSIRYSDGIMWASIAYTGYLDARSLAEYVLAEGKDSAVIATDYFLSGFTTPMYTTFDVCEMETKRDLWMLPRCERDLKEGKENTKLYGDKWIFLRQNILRYWKRAVKMGYGQFLRFLLQQCWHIFLCTI